MAGHLQATQSTVAKVESEATWVMLMSQAQNRGCPVVVHFTASWCMPSVAMGPVFQELASAHQNIMFLVVDVDEIKEVATKMEVKAMPTFVLMKNGAVVDKVVGANPDEIKKRVAGLVID
ncbi:thioredoxin [Striga asiatica]|uniref:Thioredoxin n=1 Tax=Striga asiatica TaxID=4170 RepID=A0A5A7RHB7_STRAF|nr:thioredoxin [Striga asiatica]